MSHPDKDLSSQQQQEQDARLGRRLKDTPVAIVGMASLFANAKYLDEFWDLIVDKIDAITQVPDSHWDPRDYFDADPATPDKVYCQRGGFLPEMEFNPLDFGLPPNILEQTDTAQLLALLVARDLLLDAGIEDESSYDRDKIGITLGIGGGQKISQAMNARLQYPVLKKIFQSSGINDHDSDMLIRKFQDQYIPWQENAFPGSLGNVIAGRIANRFNLGGMNCVVDAACAGSLAAVRMALSELLDGRSDMMLTGGVCTDNSPYMYMSFSKTPAFTQDDNIKPFDADSKGMMIGEGIGMIALKRLEDAERDGDRIYAVIKGIGASSDGRFKSIYAPRPEGQAKALRRAYDDAGFAPHTVGLIEAHGTGTAAGDIAEFNGLNSVFSQDDNGNPKDEFQHIALGSVKSQVGHTKSTAGTAGMIKAALALHHKVLPPTINIASPNPRMSLESSPFFLSTHPSPWLPKADGSPRRAGISSFGFGGTNFHIVLEEYQVEHASPYRLRQAAQPFLFSAESPQQLKQLLTSEYNALQTLEGTAAKDRFDELCQSFGLRALQTHQPRLGLVAKDNETLLSALSQAIDMLAKSANSPWQLPGGVQYRPSALEGKLAALFAGQGNQYLHMGHELACLYPEQRSWLARFDRHFHQAGLTPLSRVLYPIEAFDPQSKEAQQAELTDTRFAQSGIGAISAAQYQLLTQAGLQPDMLAGHSYGELTALWAAGAIKDDDYCALSLARGQVMADAADFDPKGSMAAVVIDKPEDLERLEAILNYNTDVAIANRNSPSQLVLAGEQQALHKVSENLKQQGIKVVPLQVSGAFHTPMMQTASEQFAAAIANTNFRSPNLPVWSNQTGREYGEDIGKQLSEHMLSQVDYVSQIKGMIESGCRIFVEFGPKNTQGKLVNAIAAELFPGLKTELLTLSVNPSPIKSGAEPGSDSSDKQLKLAAVTLAVAGQALTNPDTWAVKHQHHEVKPSPMNIRLNGAHYVSPATKARAQQSLIEGQIQATPTQAPTPDSPADKGSANSHDEKPVTQTQLNQAQSAHTQPSQVTQTAHPQVSRSAVEGLFQAQSEAARVHQAFLDIPKQYNETFTQLMQAQLQLATQGLPVPDSLQRSIELFHQHQADTLRVHQAYLAQMSGAGATSNAVQTASPSQTVSAASTDTATGTDRAAYTDKAKQVQAPQLESALSVAAPAPSISSEPQAAPESEQTITTQPFAGAADTREVSNILLNVVADKTGYPAEMLELSMDMEADLGIDSIKRVEILGAVQEALPQLPALSPDVLAECRTLRQVQDEILNALPAGDVSPQQPSDTAFNRQTEMPNADVQRVLLDVVADKTGYPAEMLELSMDMEADLGIDSIKRVEILGAVQEALPQLPALSPDVLAECRTLEQVQNEFLSALPHVAAGAPTTSQVQAATLAVTAATTASAINIQAALLDVVADKTGYPAEMLELSMDMEADLGIDSIKRVEILGAVQETLPQLPALSPDAMAECRTLAQILSLLESSVENSPEPINGPEPVNSPELTGSPESDQAAAQISSLTSSEDVIAVLLSVVADKTGYPAEMLELSMNMEADLGIDSIKRVEILGAVQEALPQLPSLSPEVLAECRTLAEITVQLADSLERVNSLEPANNPEPVSPPEQTSPQGLEQDPLVLSALAPLDSQQLPPFSGVTLAAAPAPGERLEFIPGSQVLLLDDGHHAGVLAEKLKAMDLVPLVLTLGQASVAATDVTQFTLSQAQLQPDLLEAELKQLFENEISNLSAVLILSDSEQIEVHRHTLEAALLLAKLSSTQLHGQTGAAVFATVTRLDGQFGYQQPELAAALASGLHGLTKTLSHEWPEIQCKALDISPEIDAHQFTAVLMAELCHQSAAVEVAISVDDESQQRLTPIPTPQNDKATKTMLQSALELDAGDTVLVSGGAKGVTLDCALHLAAHSGSNFVLLGRSQLPQTLPQWAAGKTIDELKPALLEHLKAQGEKLTPKALDASLKPVVSALEIQQALSRFEQVGASAEYLALDITDAKATADSLAPLAAIRPFSGIIHGAGVLADKRIEDKELGQFDAVFSTKIDGLAHLLANIDVDALKFISLFSSAAGFYGNSGQSDYAMANEVLNKQALALKASHPNLKVTSFNWGPWDGGMVSASLKAMFESRGVYVIPRDAGARLFANQVLNSGLLLCLVGTDMQGQTAHADTAVDTPADMGEQAQAEQQLLALEPISPSAVTNGETEVKKPEGEQSHRAVQTPAEQAVIATPLQLGQHGFLQHHSILGNPVLPTACALSLMLDRHSGADSPWQSLSGYQLLKGVVFDEKDRVELTLSCMPTNTADKDEGEQAWMLKADDRPAYKAKCEASIAPATANAAIPSRLKQALKQQAVSGELSYQTGPLFHGPELQLLKQLAIKESQLLAIVSLPEQPGEWGEFSEQQARICALDAILQGALVLAFELTAQDSLPVAIRQLTVNRQLDSFSEGLLWLHNATVMGHSVQCDASLLSESGEILAVARGIKLTLSETQLNPRRPRSHLSADVHQPLSSAETLT